MLGNLKLNPHVWKMIIPHHLILLAGIFLALFGYVSLYNLLWIPIGYLVFGYIGFSIFLHRYWSHRAFKTYKWVEFIGTYLGIMAGNGTPIVVEAIHMRLHHAHSDDPAIDPHTPLRGKLWSWFSWHNMEHQFPKLSIPMMRIPYIKFMHRHYFKIWWVSFFILFLLQWELAVFFLCGGVVYHFHVEGLINTCGHDLNCGYRNGNTNDNSVNITPKIAEFITLGNSLHHNHHLQPRNYTCALKEGEFDLGKYIIPFIIKPDSS